MCTSLFLFSWVVCVDVCCHVVSFKAKGLSTDKLYTQLVHFALKLKKYVDRFFV